MDNDKIFLNTEIEKKFWKTDNEKMLLEYGRQIVVRIRKTTKFRLEKDNDKILLECGQ